MHIALVERTGERGLGAGGGGGLPARDRGHVFGGAGEGARLEQYRGNAPTGETRKLEVSSRRFDRGDACGHQQLAPRFASGPADFGQFGFADVYSVGSIGIKMCLIAGGDYDVYINPARGKCKEWDSCAPHLILSEAGGVFTDLEGQGRTYNQTDVFLRDGLLATNGRLHEAIRERIAEFEATHGGLGRKGPVDGRGDAPHFFHQAGEFFGLERLGAVGEGAVGIGVDFDHEAVGAGGDRGPGHGRHVVPVAGAVAGVADDRQVALGLDDGDGVEVEGEAGRGLEGADAALAENDVVVALGHDVFGGLQVFADERGHAALEQDGDAGVADGGKQGVVLAVARADLEHVGVFDELIDVGDADDFGDDFEAGFGAGFGEVFERFFAQPLEGVGGGARLESAAAKKLRAGAP
jgi:hypothetical protein